MKRCRQCRVEGNHCKPYPRLPHHTYPPRDTTSFTLTLYDTRIPSTSLLAPSFTLQLGGEAGPGPIACTLTHPWSSHQDPEQHRFAPAPKAPAA